MVATGEGELGRRPSQAEKKEDLNGFDVSKSSERPGCFSGLQENAQELTHELEKVALEAASGRWVCLLFLGPEEMSFWI